VGNEIVAAMEKHIIPELPKASQGAFFAGKWEITLAEVMVAGFVKLIHLYSENEVLPKSVNERLGADQRYGHWPQVVWNLEAVRKTWFEEEALALAKMLVANANAPAGED
jgi:hypothetical protein